MFSKLGLRPKLFFLTGFFMLSALGGSILSNLSFKRSSAKYETLSSTEIPFLMSTSKISRLAKDTRVLALGLMAIPDVDVRAMLVTEAQESIDKKLKEIYAVTDIAQALHSDPSVLEQLNSVKVLQKAYETSLSAYLNLLTQTTELKKPEGKGLIGAALAELEAKSTEFEAGLQSLLDESNKRSAQSAVAANETASVGLQMNILILVATLIIGLVATFLFSRSLMKLMDRITSSVDHSTTSVHTKSAELSETAQKLSQVATEQAAALAETAASVEELQSMVEKNSENARVSAETANRSRSEAERGQAAVVEMQEAVQNINASNDRIMAQVMHSNEKVSEIVSVIQEIGAKTKVINEIVFQTKLLSFNASVEAARAGEHGKGFAVVAEEVGALAQMSGNAAQEISALLNQSIDRVGSIVTETKTKVTELIEDGKRTVSQGSETAEQCGEILKSIVSQVREVSSLAAEISRASQEQAKGVSEVSKATRQLDQATQMTAESAVHSEKLSSELLTESESLTAATTQLKKAIHGTDSQAPQHSESTNHSAQVHSLEKARSSQRSAQKHSISNSRLGAKAKATPATVNQPEASQFRHSEQKAVGADFTPRHDDEGFEEL